MACSTSAAKGLLHPPALTRAVPDFLAPCLLRSRGASQTSNFSTSPRSSYPRDNNPNRGVSPLRRTGLRRKLSVSDLPLPKPVLNPKKHSKVAVDEDHGLWGFFKDKKLLMKPEDEHSHGRAWTVEELRKKSWEDMHKLYWVCVKERNRLKTSDRERERIQAGYGGAESKDRDEVVRRTMQAIKHALTERWYAWEHARKLALDDTTVNLNGRGPAYEPYKQTLAEEEAQIAPDSPPVAPGTKIL